MWEAGEKLAFPLRSRSGELRMRYLDDLIVPTESLRPKGGTLLPVLLVFCKKVFCLNVYWER